MPPGMTSFPFASMTLQFAGAYCVRQQQRSDPSAGVLLQQKPEQIGIKWTRSPHGTFSEGATASISPSFMSTSARNCWSALTTVPP